MRTSCKQLQQTQRVLTTREAHENPVAILDELILHGGTPKASLDTLLKGHNLWLHEYQIDGADNKQEGQYVVPMQVCALEHDIGNDTEYGQ